MESKKAISVSQLAMLIKESLPRKLILVKGEIEKPKISNGHLFFTFRNQSASIKGIIWKSNNIKTDSFTDGDSIEFFARIDYYAKSGSINLVVDKIKNHLGHGKILKELEERKKTFEKKGYFDISRKKKLPLKIKNILLLTASTGDAIHDFTNTLSQANMNIDTTHVNILVQGVNCPRDVSKKINEIEEKVYDLVVITRGGGGFQDLLGFSDVQVVESCYKCKTPILSAIGHQQDVSLLDMVADVTCHTPSLAAQYIIDYNMMYLSNLEKIRIKCREKILNKMSSQINLYNIFNQKIAKQFYGIVQEKNNLAHRILNHISNRKIKLETFIRLINQMNKKISIKMKFNDKDIVSVDEVLEKLEDNKPFVLQINDKLIKISDYHFEEL